MDFTFPFKVTGLEEKDVATVQKMFKYIEEALLTRMPRTVNYTTNMNTDVGANYNEIVFCSTDDKFYGCTSPGKVGDATWVALN